MEQLDFLRYVFRVLEEVGIPYALVGSFATAVYGEPRFTQDVDVLIDARVGQVIKLCEEFPSPDYYVDVTAARQAVVYGGQFNVLHPASGNKVDFMTVRPDAWGQQQMARRLRKNVLPDCPAYTASPEDLILSKLQYYRAGRSEKHLRDIAGMLQISGAEINRKYIESWAGRLGVGQLWQMVLRKVESANS